MVSFQGLFIALVLVAVIIFIFEFFINMAEAEMAGKSEEKLSVEGGGGGGRRKKRVKCSAVVKNIDHSEEPRVGLLDNLSDEGKQFGKNVLVKKSDSSREESVKEIERDGVRDDDECEGCSNGEPERLPLDDGFEEVTVGGETEADDKFHCAEREKKVDIVSDGDEARISQTALSSELFGKASETETTESDIQMILRIIDSEEAVMGSVKGDSDTGTDQNGANEVSETSSSGEALAGETVETTSSREAIVGETVETSSSGEGIVGETVDSNIQWAKVNLEDSFEGSYLEDLAPYKELKVEVEVEVGLNKRNGEQDDDWEQVESSDLEYVFAEAVKFVGYWEKGKDHQIIPKLENHVQMQLYGLHKLAVEGPCHQPQPMPLKISARAKWNAWQRLGSMSPEVAMEQYIKLLSDTNPGWIVQHCSVDDGQQDFKGSKPTISPQTKETIFENIQGYTGDGRYWAEEHEG